MQNLDGWCQGLTIESLGVILELLAGEVLMRQDQVSQYLRAPLTEVQLVVMEAAPMVAILIGILGMNVIWASGRPYPIRS